MRLFKEIEWDVFPEFQKFVYDSTPQKLMTENHDGRLKWFGDISTIANIQELKIKVMKSTIFNDFLKKNFLHIKMVRTIQFSFTPVDVGADIIHIDQLKGESSTTVSINFPIIENPNDDSFLEFYDFSKETKLENRTIPGDAYGGANYQVFSNPNSLKFIDKCSRNKIHAIRTDIPHRIVASKSNFTYQLLVRMDKTYIKNVEEI